MARAEARTPRTTRSISSGIDHIVIATPDLELTRAEFESLGFQVTPRARHERFGTANYLCILEDAYIELIAIERHDPVDRTSLDVLKPCIANGGGVPMIALATTDATATHNALAEAGISMDAPLNWSRPADTPDGIHVASFTTLFAKTEILPDLVAFFCQHHTPDYVRHPAWRVHANTASCLLGISLVTTRAMEAVRDQVSLLAHVSSDLQQREVCATLGTHFLHYQCSSEPRQCNMVLGVRDCDRLGNIGQHIDPTTRAVTLGSVRNTTLVLCGYTIEHVCSPRRAAESKAS
jgi:hypothetical protein